MAHAMISTTQFVGRRFKGRILITNNFTMPQFRKARFASTTEPDAVKSPSGFSSEQEYLDFLRKNHGKLPAGFKTGTSTFQFIPEEAPEKPGKMTLTLIAADAPCTKFGAVFTSNKFPGAPVKVGRKRLNEKALSAIIVNNKISNVCARGGGVSDSERICAEVAKQMGYASAGEVLPSSTGVIGWRLPVESMIKAVPQVVSSLQSEDAVSAARGIMTTDAYPKIRSKKVGNGRMVGIAKGAGMIEPNLATMLSYILTDLDIPREVLRDCLSRVVKDTYNCISIDSDESTSDTVAIISSAKVAFSQDDLPEFEEGLLEICADLAEDLVRNGEGVQHVIKVLVREAPSEELARGIGKSIINSPLVKCGIAGNDPNVGRLVMSIGKYLGKQNAEIDLGKCQIHLGGLKIFSEGEFHLDGHTERMLSDYLKECELSGSTPYPEHFKSVEVEVTLGSGEHSASVIGADLTHGYVTENADYRS